MSRYLSRIATIAIILAGGWKVPIVAQPVLVPVEHNSDLLFEKHYERSVKRGGGTLTLPFFDDFSNEGPYPGLQRWEDDRVYVNASMGKNPVSVGVATFDGVDSSGAPYGGGYGPSDRLTSAAVNVLSANPNRLFLTFYLQAGGYSYKPEEQDSFIVQFRDVQGNWSTVKKFTTDSLPDTDSFYFFSVKLDQDYFLGQFRFRFINYSDNAGITDVWNLDYVKLAEEATSNQRRETDIAFTLPPNSILKDYNAMPWNHFYGFGEQELRDQYTVELYNHSDMTLQADSSFLAVREEPSGNAPIPSETLLELPPVVPENQRDLSPGRHRFTNDIKTADYAQQYLNLFDPTAERNVFHKDYIFRQSQEGTFGTRKNNSVTHKTVFANYFAYDDGSAESGIQFNYGGNNQPALAVRFRSNVADTLRSIQIMFPHTADNDAQQEFRLNIWGTDLNAGPIYSSPVMTPVFVHEELQLDSLQGLTTYDLKSAATGNDTLIPVSQGIFYVGWTQVSSSNRGVLVGFDRNDPGASGNNFYHNGSQWQALDSISPFFDGAVIIRPVTVAPPYLIPTPTLDPAAERIDPGVYPNPATTTIHAVIDERFGSAAVYQIFGADGKMWDSGTLDGPLKIESLPAGSYWLRVYSPKSNIFGVAAFKKIK